MPVFSIEIYVLFPGKSIKMSRVSRNVKESGKKNIPDPPPFPDPRENRVDWVSFQVLWKSEE